LDEAERSVALQDRLVAETSQVLEAATQQAAGRKPRYELAGLLPAESPRSSFHRVEQLANKPIAPTT
jgi:hypothetical protein